MTAWYNENDPKAAEWLRELIRAGLIAPGDVDTRSIEDVTPDDLRGYTQCHFFAGIGGWSLALRLAGWHDDRPVWTGSCPCQPFSAAGKGDGFADERHLWPAWHHLIRVRRPPVVFGEQVASKDGLLWLDLVQADMEGEDYACGAGDLCSAGFGAPHIRQRLGFAADDLRSAAGRVQHPAGDGWGERRAEPGGRSAASGRRLDGLADRDDAGLEGWGQPGRGCAVERASGAGSMAGGPALANGRDPGTEGLQRGGEYRQRPQDGGTGRVADGQRFGHADILGEGYLDLASRRDDERAFTGPESCDAVSRPGPTNGFWRDADWLYCRDDKWRPVEPGTFPLAHGISGRVGLLRGYGNAINPHQFAAFIEAYLDRETIEA